jgi:putative inorganic carbon (HCO3(-)) transporter
MRDVLLAAIIIPLIPVSFLRPWIGVLVFAWIGFMNPHLHTYGFARWRMQWAEMVAMATLAGLVLNKDRKPFIWCRESILMIAIWAWFLVTTVFSFYPEDAWWQLERVSKVMLMTLITIPLLQERARMRWMLLVMAGSLGFYGVKAGIFVILSGGNYMVMGAPGNTFVSSNNAIALALNMCLPLFWYLRKDEERLWARHLLLAAFWLSAIAVPFTYSRGGVLGLGCVLTILAARSRRRYIAFPLLYGAAILLFAMAPEKWVARMDTIQDYESDQSAISRLDAWQMGIRIANDRPLFGGGFWAFNRTETYAKYAPYLGPRSTDAHSIYFNLLGEHGYVGLGLFLLLVCCTYASLLSLYRMGRRHKEITWVSDYAYMLFASITAYLVTGTFLSVAYFDLAWHLLALVVVLKELARRELAALAPAPVARSMSQARAQIATGSPLPASLRKRV